MQHPPQPEAEGAEMLMEMPSFRSISVGQEWPQLLLGYLHEPDDVGHHVEGETGEEEEGEFDFRSASRDSLDGLEPVDAEEVFSDGRIQPFYPLFGRALVLDQGDGKAKISDMRIQDGDGDGDNAGAIGQVEESIDLCLSFRDFMIGDGGPLSTSSSSSSSSWESSDKLEAVPVESYCVWLPVPAPPSPDLCKKRHSAGASSATSNKWRLPDLVSGRSRSDGKERFVFASESVCSAAETAKNKDKKKG